MRNFVRNLPLPPGQVAGVVVGVLLDRLRAVWLPGPRIAHWAAGSVLVAAGCALTIWAVVERRRHAPAGFDLEHPQTLVTTGPYALSRHPMYVGWWLLHLGFGVLRGSAWILATVPAAILIEHRMVLVEERMLVHAFGQQFLAYATRVPRYLPITARSGYRYAADGSSPEREWRVTSTAQDAEIPRNASIPRDASS